MVLYLMAKRWTGMSKLDIKIGSMSWKNPVTVASGTFGYEYGELFNLSKLGAVVTKTITLHPKIGNEPCRLAETRAGLLNSIGLQNPGVEEFITDDLSKYDKYKTNLIVSISGSTIGEFCQIAEGEIFRHRFVHTGRDLVHGSGFGKPFF